MPKKDSGLVYPSNTDVSKRKPFKNSDGSVSTVRSFSIGTDRGEVLLSGMKARRGQVYPQSQNEAIKDYKRTGKHLGVYKDPSYATEAGISLHNREQKRVEASSTKRKAKKK